MRQELLFKNYKDRHYCIFEAGSGGNGAMHFHRDKMIGRLIDSSNRIFEIYNILYISFHIRYIPKI